MSSRFEWERALRNAELPPTRKAVLQALSTFANKAGEARPSQEKIAEATGFTRRTVGIHIRAAIEDGWIVRLVKGRSSGRGGKPIASVYLLTIPASNGKDVPIVPAGSNGKQVPTGSENEWEPDDLSNGKQVPTFSTRNILSSHPPVENASGQPVDHAARARQIQQILRSKREAGPFDDAPDDLSRPAVAKLLGQWGEQSA